MCDAVLAQALTIQIQDGVAIFLSVTKVLRQTFLHVSVIIVKKIYLAQQRKINPAVCTTTPSGWRRYGFRKCLPPCVEAYGTFNSQQVRVHLLIWVSTVYLLLRYAMGPFASV